LAAGTMLFVADDMAGLSSALDQASTAAIATVDSPVVLIIKDTQVSMALRGSSAERELREAMSSNVRMFVCEADLLRYGFNAKRVMPGIAVVKAPVPKAEGSAPQAAEAQPLERFRKQADKVCEQ
jgi:intracellular sulfur oxidation DsrE/DsrF family protein